MEKPQCYGLAEFLRTDESLRKICQREIALKKNLGTPSQVRVLKKLSRDAWLLERDWRYMRTEVLDAGSYLQRGFEQWRSVFILL